MTKPIISKTAIGETKKYLTKIGMDDDTDFLRESVQLLNQMLKQSKTRPLAQSRHHSQSPLPSSRTSSHNSLIWIFTYQRIYGSNLLIVLTILD